MVVNKLQVEDCINHIISRVDSVPGLEDKNMYLFGGCGLVMHGVYNERDTEDLDIFYPDSLLLPNYSDKFRNGGYAGVVYYFPNNFQLEKAELFQLLGNETLEDYIMNFSKEIKKQGDTKIFLPLLEALTVNKIQSYEPSPERRKDYRDVLSIFEYKKGDKEFERKLMNLLEECELSEKYNRLFK